MFAPLALAGDVGCAIGPAFVGIISEHTENGSIPNIFSTDGSGLKMGILLAVIFPTVAIFSVLFLLKRRHRDSKK